MDQRFARLYWRARIETATVGAATVGSVGSPVFIGGRGLKHTAYERIVGAVAGFARLYWRARIETPLAAAFNRACTGSPVFIGGRGLKPENWLM